LHLAAAPRGCGNGIITEVHCTSRLHLAAARCG